MSWYYLIEQTQHGPVAEADLRASLVENKIPPDTFVWHEGMADWLPASQIPALATATDTSSAHLVLPNPDPVSEPTYLEGEFPVTLAQKKIGNPNQVLILESPDRLLVRTGLNDKVVERRIDVALVDPNVERVRRPFLKPLILVVPFILFAISVIGFGIVTICLKGTESILGSIFGILFASGFFWLPAILFTRQIYAKSVNAYIFQLHRSDPLVIHADKPDAPAVEAFVSQLKDCIIRAQAARPQMTAALFTAKAEIAAPPPPTGCVNCHSQAIVPGFTTPLCQPCRDKLIRYPFPLWLKVAGVIISFVLVFALTRLPREISAAVALKRGEKAEISNDLPAAIKQYQAAIAAYPDSPDANRKLAVAALHAGDLVTAQAAAVKLVDKNGQVMNSDATIIQQINEAEKK
jgi:hypothetical protein